MKLLWVFALLLVACSTVARGTEEQMTENNWAEQPTLSPDGTRLAYISNTDKAIHVRALSSGNDIPLSLTAGHCSDPDWSKTCELILFKRSRFYNWNLSCDSARSDRPSERFYHGQPH